MKYTYKETHLRLIRQRRYIDDCNGIIHEYVRRKCEFRAEIANDFTTSRISFEQNLADSNFSSLSLMTEILIENFEFYSPFNPHFTTTYTYHHQRMYCLCEHEVLQQFDPAPFSPLLHFIFCRTKIQNDRTIEGR